MELKQVSIVRSPDCQDRVRLCGEVSYDQKSAVPEVYWLEVSEKYAEHLSESGNPWLACLLPLAVTLGEPLRISMPIDRVLFENAQELMQIWKCWYPHLHIIPIETYVFDAARQAELGRTAAFFSGGVDSFFTVLRHTNGLDAVRKVHIDDLICLRGFDVPLKNGEAFRRMREILSGVASDLGTELIDVAMNLRETTWAGTDWARLSHGCALASVALALENLYKQVLIPASDGLRFMEPWGSHPLTDRLLSSGMLRIVHDGAQYSRIQKIKYCAQSPFVLRALRVCWKSENDENCCACYKCYEAMLALELFVGLGSCTSFKNGTAGLGSLEQVYCQTDYHASNFRELRAIAVEKRRPEIVRAIDLSLKRSARLNKWIPRVKRMETWLGTKRFVWRWAGSCARAMLGVSIT